MKQPPSIVADLVQRLHPDLREDYEERAGIIEFDAAQPRELAEALAMLDVLRRHPAGLLGVWEGPPGISRPLVVFARPQD